MNTVQWVTEKYRKVYLSNNKEMTEMSFICQWNSKEFHLDRTLFEDISLSTERHQAKTNRACTVESHGKAVWATSVSAQL